MIASDIKHKSSKKMELIMLKKMIKSFSILWILLWTMTYADASEEEEQERTHIWGLVEIPLEDSATFGPITSDSRRHVALNDYGSCKKLDLPSQKKGKKEFMKLTKDNMIEISYVLPAKDFMSLSMTSTRAMILLHNCAIVRAITWKVLSNLGNRVPLPPVSTGNDENDHKIVDFLYTSTMQIKELEKVQQDDLHLRNLINGFYDSLGTDVRSFIDDYEPRLSSRTIGHHTYKDKVNKVNYLKAEWKEEGFFDCCQISNMICKHDCDNCFFDMKDRDDYFKQSCQDCCNATGSFCSSCWMVCFVGSAFICFSIFKPCCCPKGRC